MRMQPLVKLTPVFVIVFVFATLSQSTADPFTPCWKGCFNEIGLNCNEADVSYAKCVCDADFSTSSRLFPCVVSNCQTARPVAQGILDTNCGKSSSPTPPSTPSSSAGSGGKRKGGYLLGLTVGILAGVAWF